MKERPINLRQHEVAGILGGRQTQLRRIVRPQPELAQVLTSSGWSAWHNERGRPLRNHYGQPGDRLWVRESHLLDPPIDGAWPSVGDTFAAVADIPKRYRNPSYVLYRADEKLTGDWRWRPSIHMPRWASRIALEITTVRVERVQDISERDAWAEGCEGYDDDFTGGKSGYAEFAERWQSIHGPGSWGANPWMWVIEFRRLP